MRKLSLLLVLCMLLACFASCGDNTTQTPDTTDDFEVTTKAPAATKAPEDTEETTEKETETDAPETPQDKWTERY